MRVGNPRLPGVRLLNYSPTCADDFARQRLPNRLLQFGAGRTGSCACRQGRLGIEVLAGTRPTQLEQGISRSGTAGNRANIEATRNGINRGLECSGVTHLRLT